MSRHPEFERTPAGVRVYLSGASFYLSDAAIARLTDFLEGGAATTDGGARRRNQRKAVLRDITEAEFAAELERRSAEAGSE